MFDDPWEQYYDDEVEDYKWDQMPDQVIEGLADGYDDGRIDHVIWEMLRLRKVVQQNGL